MKHLCLYICASICSYTLMQTQPNTYIWGWMLKGAICLLLNDCLTWPVAGCHAVCQEKIAMAEKILVECPVKGWSYIRGILLIKACNMMIILTPLRQSFIPTEGEKLHPHAGRCWLGSEQDGCSRFGTHFFLWRRHHLPYLPLPSRAIS